MQWWDPSSHRFLSTQAPLTILYSVAVSVQQGGVFTTCLYKGASGLVSPAVGMFVHQLKKQFRDGEFSSFSASQPEELDKS